MNVRSHPPHCLSKEKTASQDTLNVLPVGAVNGSDYSPSIIKAEAWQLTARGKDRAMSRNGAEAKSPSWRELDLEPQFAGLTEVQCNSSNDICLSWNSAFLQIAERPNDSGLSTKVI